MANSRLLFPRGCTRLLPAIGLLVLIFAFCWSCGDDTATNDDGVDPADTGLIGPAGGTFTDTSSGVTVSVPAGALSSDTRLTCNHYATPDDIPDSVRCAVFGELGVVDLGPDGLQFDSAVTVTVPVSVALTPGAQFPLFTWNSTNHSWEQTESMCTASADGTSYSAEVTHFSMFSGDQLNGIDGIFGNLDPTHWIEVNTAFQDWVGAFCFDMSTKNRKMMRDCCMEVTGRKFTCVYEGTVPYSRVIFDGDTLDYDHVDRYEVRRSYQDPTAQLHLTASIYWSCKDPSFVDVETSQSTIDLNSDPSGTAEIKMCGVCYIGRVPGIHVDFTLNGPGSISPSSTTTGADGYAYTTYSTSDTGTATITGTMVSCQDWEEPHSMSESVTIRVTRCSDWYLHVEMSFAHSPENWEFQDEIQMIIPLVITEGGLVSSAGGQGSQSASLTALHENCAVTYESAPDFEPGASGEKVGPNIYVTIAPVADWELMYVLMCNLDDEPIEVPLPPYNYLIPSIMASQVFNEFPIELRSGVFYNGSGQDTQWGTDNPITYTYHVNVGCGGISARGGTVTDQARQ